MAARQIILDTETTGLYAHLGDRVIEIGCIELINRRRTGKHFHRYLNPGRDIHEGASKVHGLTREDLSDKPRFTEIAAEFIDFLRGAELVIHNAPFDVEFLDRELALAELGNLASHCAGVIDTLALARELHPGKKNNLNALCERYAVDNSQRTLHGALLDASLLAEVYLTMTRGQESLLIEPDEPLAAQGLAAFDASMLIVLRATPDELAAHAGVLAAIDAASGQRCLWRQLMAA